MEGMACSWRGASYTSKSCKITATLTQAVTPSYSISPSSPGLDWRVKAQLELLHYVKGANKKVMSPGLEIKCEPHCKWWGRLQFKGRNRKSHLSDAGYQLLQALGGSIAIWGASNFAREDLH